MTESRTCSACGETKPLSEFHRDKQAKSGFKSTCKECVREYFMSRPFYACFISARNRAKARGVPFDLTEEYLESIWTGVCPVFQVRLDLPSHGKAKVRTTSKPSLDRLVPDKGYVPGNVIWISLRANQMKSDGTSEELFKVAEWLKQTEEEIKRHETD